MIFDSVNDQFTDALNRDGWVVYNCKAWDDYRMRVYNEEKDIEIPIKDEYLNDLDFYDIIDLIEDEIDYYESL